MLFSDEKYEKAGIFRLFYCPGCERYHAVYRDSHNIEDLAGLPSVFPDLLIDFPGHRCHLFIQNGLLAYLDDCDHHLAGMTVEMVGLNP